MPLRVTDALGPHVLRVLGEVLAERRRRHPDDPHLFHERVRGTLPMAEIGNEPDDRGNARRHRRFGQLLRRFPLDHLPAVAAKADVRHPFLDATAGDGQFGIIVVSVPLDDPGEVCRAGDGVGAGDGVHDVAVAHLAGVVDDEDGYPVRA